MSLEISRFRKDGSLVATWVMGENGHYIIPPPDDLDPQDGDYTIMHSNHTTLVPPSYAPKSKPIIDKIVINTYEGDNGEGITVATAEGVEFYDGYTSWDSPEDNSVSRLGLDAGFAALAKHFGAQVEFVSFDPDAAAEA